MKYTISECDAGLTIKSFLYGRLKFSTALVKRVKYREGGILLNGESATVRRILSKGDVLELLWEDAEEDENEYTAPFDIPIDIIYEDEFVTVVNKPPMMPSHPSLGHKDDTVANALAYKYKNAPFVFRPVNRLDRDTSGIMIIARNKISACRLCAFQKSGLIHKSYIAVLRGIVTPERGEISSFMAREEGSIIKRRVCDSSFEGAKFALTRYKTLSSSCGLTAVAASPVTGRTHQLRVHFASVGCPILGDSMYGEPSELISRQALHAAFIEFPHPESGETLRLSAAVPRDIRECCDIDFDSFDEELLRF